MASETVADARPTRRLTRSQRRHQLLDVAAAKVVEHGVAQMSMERLAEWAGVSKALPYAHFENVEAVLVALYQREWVAIGRSIVQALEDADPSADLAAVRAAAYLDAVGARAAVIEALTFPGSTIPRAADPGREGPRYSAGLLYRYHGVEKSRALAVAGILQGAMIGATTSWLHSGAPRAVVEESLAAVIRALVGNASTR